MLKTPERASVGVCVCARDTGTFRNEVVLKVRFLHFSSSDSSAQSGRSAWWRLYQQFGAQPDVEARTQLQEKAGTGIM